MRSIKGRRRQIQPILVAAICSPALAGCSASPAQDLLGAFFPAWMLCAGVGILSTVLLRQIICMLGIATYLVAAPVTYLSFAISGTLIAWLFWFAR
jgi:YtcA family